MLSDIKVWSVLALFILTGCVSTQKGDLVLPPDAQVGVLLLQSDNPSYVHVGTTVFQNQTHQLSQDWEVNEFIVKELESQLGNLAEVKLLERPKELTGKTSTMNAWLGSLDDALVPVFQTLIERHQLSALIVIESPGRTFEPNTSTTAKGYGVYTRCTLGICKAEVYDHLTTRVLSASPVKYVSRGYTPYGAGKIDIDLSQIPENLSDKDIARAKEIYLPLLKENIHMALVNSGMLDSTAP